MQRWLRPSQCRRRLPAILMNQGKAVLLSTASGRGPRHARQSTEMKVSRPKQAGLRGAQKMRQNQGAHQSPRGSHSSGHQILSVRRQSGQEADAD